MVDGLRVQECGSLLVLKGPLCVSSRKKFPIVDFPRPVLPMQMTSIERMAGSLPTKLAAPLLALIAMDPPPATVLAGVPEYMVRARAEKLSCFSLPVSCFSLPVLPCKDELK